MALGIAVACAACGDDGAKDVTSASTAPSSAGTMAPAATSGDAAAVSTTSAPTAGTQATMNPGDAGNTSSDSGSMAPTTGGTSSDSGSMAPTTGGTSSESGSMASSTGGTSSEGVSADGGADVIQAPDDTPMPSDGCMGGSLRAGRTMGSIQASGRNRTYIQYIPGSYDGTTPVPVVVDLHPFSVGASFAELSSGFRQLADAEGYLYVAPQGIGNEWDSVGDTDEIFIRDLVNDIASTGCIDLRRIYATGCSNGGAFSFLLMCTAEDIFAAVAPMCGTAFFDLETQCILDRPVPLMLRIGLRDTLNCWEGEGISLNAPNVQGGTKVPCATTVQRVLGDKYHCTGEIRQEAQCEYLGDCDEGAEIAICGENTGHVVYQLNTARDTWAFLKRFYKR
ncbi:MAG: hypothetical protein JXA30_01010 [Deltaproteobacteria bacterium]|nr:hypothetical protein [Deltaproteobacteria bacterium]